MSPKASRPVQSLGRFFESLPRVARFPGNSREENEYPLRSVGEAASEVSTMKGPDRFVLALTSLADEGKIRVLGLVCSVVTAESRWSSAATRDLVSNLP